MKKVSFKNPVSAWLYLLTTILVVQLSGCGGSTSGTGTGGGTQAPDPPTIRVNAVSSSVPANPGLQLPSLTAPRTTQVNVMVRTNANTPVADGTVVNLSTGNALIGTVSAPNDPDDDDGTNFSDFFSSISSETSGGSATFFFTSGETPGTVTLTASTTDPATGTGLTATVTITVTAVTVLEPVTITANDTSLPVNNTGAGPFVGSPFLTEVSIQLVDPNGVGVNPAGDSFGVSITPVTTASFSTLDDPETEDVNEFFVSLGSGPVDATGGQATVFVNSGSTPGTASLNVTGVDPTTGQNFSETLVFTVHSGAVNGIPASSLVSVPGTPVFVQGVGGNTSVQVNATVLDAGGQPADLTDPSSMINNVLVELSPPGPNGSSLSSTNAAGAPVNGTSIAIQTTNGVADFAFLSGNTGGVHQITVTADAADNNVDNGVQSPVSNTGNVIVGDGELASVQLSSELLAGAPEVSDAVMPGAAPGIFMLPIGVIANDRFGAPVLPGTVISFGKVDAPLTGTSPAVFSFSGSDGNPQEGGTFFSVTSVPPDGFLDNPMAVDEAVSSGDAVITFGEDVAGNVELESMRIVASVATNTSLSVTDAFNNNDASGALVNDGAVIPYVIGRSVVGTLGPSAVVTADGTASVNLTYPGSALGMPLVIWAQGNRIDNGESQTVADAEQLVFPGQGPAILSVNPGSVPGNDTGTVLLCLTDTNGFAIPNSTINFVVNGSFNFTTDVDPLVTQANGCVTTDVTSSGVVSFGMDSTVTFTAAGARADLLLTNPMNPAITVSPNMLEFSGMMPVMGDVTVLTTVGGAPADGIQITAVCDNPLVTVAPMMQVSDGSGSAMFSITVTPDPMDPMADDASEIMGTCTFAGNFSGTQLSALVGINGPPGVIVSPPPP